MTAEKKENNQKKIDAQIGQALFSDTERFEMWFAAYWKPAAAVALVIAIVAAIAFWIVTARDEADKKAAFALADAATVEELTAALKENADNSGAPIARFRLAKMLLDAEKYQEAAAQFDLIAKNPTAEPLLAAQSALAAGYAAELSGKLKEAAERFLKIENNIQFPAAQRAEAGYCAGRLFLKAGDIKQSKAILSRTAMMGSANAGIGYWTENAKQTVIAIDNGEYAKAAPAVKAVKKAQVKKAK